MGKDDEYELLPKQEVDMLKKEIARLKKNPLGDLPEGENMLDAINNLNTNISKLIDIFSKAGADLASDYSEGTAVEDIKTIKEQNDDIAEGLVAVADMVKDIKESAPKPGFFPTAEAQPAPQTQRHQHPRIAMTTPGQEQTGLPPPGYIPPPPTGLGSHGPAPELPSLDMSPPRKRRRLFSKK